MANIIKVEKPERYTIVSNAPLNDTSISFRAKGLLCYLLSKPSGWEVNVKQLVGAGTDGRDAVYATLKELKEAGYVVMTECREEGKFIAYNYTVYEEKQPTRPLPEIPDTEMPVPEIPTGTGRNNRIRQSRKHSNYLIPAITEEVSTEDQPKKPVEKSVEDRKNDFKKMVVDWHNMNPQKYPKLMLVKFCRYWTEQSLKKRKTILRFENEEFFELSRRLATWFGNSKDAEIRLNWESNERIAPLEQLLAAI